MNESVAFLLLRNRGVGDGQQEGLGLNEPKLTLQSSLPVSFEACSFRIAL